MYAHILIPTDGSNRSRRAVRTGVALAKSLKADVTALIATPTYKMFTLDRVMSRDSLGRYSQHSLQFARKALTYVEEQASSHGVSCKVLHIISDYPAKQIVRAARRRHIDLIVMASHGRSGIRGLLLGSETQKVLHASNIAVMVCR